ncbi:MAG: cob(I)yrinic acid a,c-diamide adenosyltransferase [Bacteroidales bacterium]|nr:cob(I)yrinic acid a,c-diamide adenosyltransferase [Candidatus Cacconaster merdequi]
MKIYTKAGDKGNTSLVGGKRVSKAHPRVMAYGDLDELISCIGLIRCHSAEADSQLRRIQVHLMNVSAHLASEGESAKLKPLDDEEISFLESQIDRMTGEIPPQTAFILPGKPAVSSLCHIARTVCRRAERSAVQIEDRDEQDEKALAYINRLSDYLFTLARYLCWKQGCEDDFWLP